MEFQPIPSQNTSHKTPIIAPHSQSANQVESATSLAGRLAAALVPPGDT